MLQRGSFELGGNSTGCTVYTLNFADRQFFTDPSQKTGAGRERRRTVVESRTETMDLSHTLFPLCDSTQNLSVSVSVHVNAAGTCWSSAWDSLPGQ